MRAHLVEQLAQVGDLGLAGGVVDDGRALRPHGSHHEVLGCANRWELEQHTGALQILGTGVDVAVRRVELGTEFLQATHVHVDRPGTEIIAAGHGHPSLATAGEHRTHDDDRGTELLDDLVGRHWFDLGGNIDAQGRAIAGDAAAGGAQQIRHQVDIGDARHVVQVVRALREQGRRHQLQDRVLGAADGNGSLEWPSPTDADLFDRLHQR